MTIEFTNGNQALGAGDTFIGLGIDAPASQGGSGQQLDAFMTVSVLPLPDPMKITKMRAVIKRPSGPDTLIATIQLYKDNGAALQTQIIPIGDPIILTGASRCGEVELSEFVDGCATIAPRVTLSSGNVRAAVTIEYETPNVITV